MTVRSHGYASAMENQRMACWRCGTPMIWGGDHDHNDITDGASDDQSFIISNFRCPDCESTAYFHHSDTTVGAS